LFLIPAPSREVRRVIEASRAREMASPLHERERANAAPSLLRAHWEEIARVARQLGVPGSRPGDGYDAAVYVGVYRRLLRHRRRATLPITSVLPVRASPYELGAVASELMPTRDEVERIMLQVEAYPAGQLEREADNWYAG
jgi:hypothetical protein